MMTWSGASGMMAGGGAGMVVATTVAVAMQYEAACLWTCQVALYVIPVDLSGGAVPVKQSACCCACACVTSLA